MLRFDRLAAPVAIESVPPLTDTVPAPDSDEPLASVYVPPPKLRAAPELIAEVEAATLFQLPPDQSDAPLSVSAESDIVPLVSVSVLIVAVPAPASVPPLTVRFERLAEPAPIESVPPLIEKVPAPVR